MLVNHKKMCKDRREWWLQGDGTDRTRDLFNDTAKVDSSGDVLQECEQTNNTECLKMVMIVNCFLTTTKTIIKQNLPGCLMLLSSTETQKSHLIKTANISVPISYLC